MKWIIKSILLLLLFTGCATSPTGRKQLILLPNSQLNQMGIQSFQEMKAKQPIENDPRINRYVKCVAFAIVNEATDSTGVKDWEVVVFRDNSANAFALPGGKIGVHTGILPIAKTPGQLAAVLGHEVGHVIARHGSERVSQGLASQVGMIALDSAMKDSKSKGVIFAGLGLGLQVGVLLPFSRTHESEADQIGQKLMAQAGFDPSESVELWKNMGKAAGGNAPPELLSTHPSSSTRIDQLSRQLNETMPMYRNARSRGKNPNCHQ